MTILKKLINDPLNWVKPKWCKHIYFWSRPASNYYGTDFEAQGGWSFKTNEAPCGLTVNKWKFCPICGASNPCN